jgi:hypothetical protein
MKTIYLYVLNTMADWEVGHAIAELNLQRFFAERKGWLLKTFSLAKEPVVTMGGITIVPDLSEDEVKTDDAGMLDNVKHTSNGLPYLKMVCPNYKGDQHYQNELAVTDKDLITAGSTSQVEFAYHILTKLEVFESTNLEYW